MSRQPSLLAVLVAAVALGAAACGIPTDDAPRPLAEETTTTTTLVGDADDEAFVYLVGAGNKLELVSRPLTGEKTAQTVLEALLPQPTEQEAQDGLTSLIPPETTALRVTQDDDLVVADMSVDWERLAEPSATTAYAQVVLTLTDLPNVDRVSFLIDGVEIAAPTAARGQQAIVTADDYDLLDPGDN